VLKNATALGDTAALEAALQPGGVDAATRAVTDAMAAHVTHEAVQQCGCHALATLASVATRLGAKSEQGAGARQPRAAGRRAQLELMAAAVVSAMDAHAESEQVQLHGCTALTIIGVEGSEAIAEVDGARTAVKALRSHAGVWEAACGALHCIAASSVRGRTAVVEAGAVPIVREVMATDRLDSRGTATGWGRGGVATHPENQEWPFTAFSFVHVRHVHVLCHSLYLWLQTIVPAWAQPPPMPSPAQPAPVPVAPGLAAMLSLRCTCTHPRCRNGTVLSWIARRMDLLTHAMQGERGRVS